MPSPAVTAVSSTSTVGDVVNLNRFRKRKAKLEEQARADENAIRQGRTPTERARVDHERERRDAVLDGARREPSEPRPDDETDGG